MSFQRVRHRIRRSLASMALEDSTRQDVSGGESDGRRRFFEESHIGRDVRWTSFLHSSRREGEFEVGIATPQGRCARRPREAGRRRIGAAPNPPFGESLRSPNDVAGEGGASDFDVVGREIEATNGVAPVRCGTERRRRCG